jgi:maltooligosyltrehalose synthase
VVPRLVTGLGDDWAGTAVALPGGAWTDVLTDGALDGGAASVAALWRCFPVAVLARQA